MVEVLPADREGTLHRASALLAEGLVLAIPTDTVYGVAVDPFVNGATQRLFDAKRRPRDVPLPILVAERSDVERVAVVTPAAAALMDAHWPGGLTIVLERASGLTADLGTEEATVGVRCPDHEFVRALCRGAGRPLAVTSANLHGRPTPPDAAGVLEELGGAVALVVDGGTCAGSPSTVVDCSSGAPVVLRQGAVPLAL